MSKTIYSYTNYYSIYLQYTQLITSYFIVYKLLYPHAHATSPILSIFVSTNVQVCVELFIVLICALGILVFTSVCY